MIPQCIHYCWFGGNPLPPLALTCITSWKQFCPGYEVVEWNESNFDINYNTYVKEAYDAGKWAFVSDVARLWVLVNHGGIYMDTDCELVKPIDKFLTLDAVSGFEDSSLVPTALMGCRKGHALFKELLMDYDAKKFILPGGRYDTTPNVTIITNTLEKKGLVLNNKQQTIAGFTLYPSDYFCPKNHKTGEINLTENTHAIHHFDGSWLTDEQKHSHKIIARFRRKYGNRMGFIIYMVWSVLTFKKKELKYIISKTNRFI
jgi:mannosyltransferase OCH1-like enzyme